MGIMIYPLAIHQDREKKITSAYLTEEVYSVVRQIGVKRIGKDVKKWSRFNYWILSSVSNN